MSNNEIETSKIGPEFERDGLVFRLIEGGLHIKDESLAQYLESHRYREEHRRLYRTASIHQPIRRPIGEEHRISAYQIAKILDMDIGRWGEGYDAVYFHQDDLFEAAPLVIYKEDHCDKDGHKWTNRAWYLTEAQATRLVVLLGHPEAVATIRASFDPFRPPVLSRIARAVWTLPSRVADAFKDEGEAQRARHRTVSRSGGRTRRIGSKGQGKAPAAT